ncbi:VOC family protein [Actinokineospora sp.]|uniref:VOC family protein n=1 Tax=Actinokineospora sp. TaxID=1872133 RepID=UPI004037C7AA
MSIPVTGYHHVRLTVTDIARSRAFYDSVFGFDVAFELPADPTDEQREQLWFLFGGVIYRIPGGLFGLRPMAEPGDRFDENRIGLDHLSFTVTSRADLDAAAARLDELGVAHEPVKDVGAGYLIEFRDPDNIALELFAPA